MSGNQNHSGRMALTSTLTVRQTRPTEDEHVGGGADDGQQHRSCPEEEGGPGREKNTKTLLLSLRGGKQKLRDDNLVARNSFLGLCCSALRLLSSQV